MDDEFVERRIVTGMITSDEYLREVSQIYNPKLIASDMARQIAGWCMEYFGKYNKAPNKHIEDIFFQKMQNGIDKEVAEDIEETLHGLSEEYERTQFNVSYLLDQTHNYFKEQNIKLFVDVVRDELRHGSVLEAERLASSYTSVIKNNGSWADPFKGEENTRKAFEVQAKPLITFPKVLGEYMNSQFVRGGLVGFSGMEKIGKTFFLIELAVRAMKSGCNVAFFQAGDMAENEWRRRLGIYLTKRSDKEKYCGELLVPVVDCVYNQTDTCQRDERECDFGVFGEGVNRDDLTHDQLSTAYYDNQDYRPCRNCKRIKGSTWFTKREPVNPLTWREAYKAVRAFQRKWRKQLRLVTYPNETLTILEMNTLLDTWEHQDGFVADVLILDYVDLLAADTDYRRLDYRQQQNKHWQRLRAMSQKRHCLVVTATQVAARSYDKSLLRMSDFSETKTKYSHVTAMYGLNQTDDEKLIGILRVNELVVREGDFDRKSTVKVLQRLQMGRPFLGSYF